ncbi:cytoplasmic protein, partial [Morganella morganii]
TPGERGDTPLSHVDFAVVAKSLACSDEWSQVVGGTEFGGAVWRMAPDTDGPVQGNGERDEQ